MSKRTMALDLTEREMDVLDKLCESKGLDKNALMRQALRLYQVVDTRLEQGNKLVATNRRTEEKSDLQIL